MSWQIHGNQRSGINQSIDPGHPTTLPELKRPNIIVTMSDNKEYVEESGAENSQAGPEAGVLGTSTPDTDPKHLISGTGGASISVDGDTIRLVNSAGAGIVIEADGSVYIISTGKKGLGIVSSMGPVGVNSKSFVVEGGEQIEMKGDNIITRAKMDIVSLSEGLISNKSKQFQQVVAGSYSNIIEGDRTDITGGINREVVGGEKWTQVSSFYKIDSNDSLTFRSRADSSINFEGNTHFYTDGDMTFSGKNVNFIAKEKTRLNADEDIEIGSQTNVVITGKEEARILGEKKISVESGETTQIIGPTKLQLVSNDPKTDKPILLGGSASKGDVLDSVEVKESAKAETMGTTDVLKEISIIKEYNLASAERNPKLMPRAIDHMAESVNSEA